MHHNLIQSILDYHHIPDHVKKIVQSLYSDFKISIITLEFSTPYIPVGRRVLQGDCLSPLLFNMCFNTFIQHIKSEKCRQFGFSLSNVGLYLNPDHWFNLQTMRLSSQLSQESENQHLLNRFSIWCKWADMIVRVDKCSTFGIKKVASKSVQYLPKLIINNILVPCIKIGESFTYLGRYFDFEMTNQSHTLDLSTAIEEMMSDIDQKPLHPKNKLLIYNRYVLSKISWHFTVADLSKTWVSETIGSLALHYIRKWLDLPVCGTLSNVFLLCNKFGLNICPPSVKFTQYQTVQRKALKSSPNEEIKSLWSSTSVHTNIQYDVFKSTKDVIKKFQADPKRLNYVTVFSPEASSSNMS